MLREDAELHMFQVLEAAFRHYDLSSDPEEKRVHLLAATPLYHRPEGDEEHPLVHPECRAPAARRVAQRARRRRLERAC